MDQASWDRIAQLFHEGLEVAPGARAQWLSEVTKGNSALAEEVVAMLAAHESTEGLRIEARLMGHSERTGSLSALSAGTMLGHYRIESLVGEGGMGEVYRAERVDGEYRQTVAIKLLRPGLLTAETVRRFRTERQVLARLTHPDIVPILDGGTAPDGRPFLVLQFVNGEPVTQYCDRHKLDVADRLRLFRRIAEAVQYAHGHLVVHRDIKPSNIMVQADGAPRLLDFGIAKLLDQDVAGSSFAVTRPEVRMLTPEHASPEQLRGEPIGTATDVYGLGVLLFELLTGRRPFQSGGRTTGQLTQSILEEPPPLPSAVAIGQLSGKRVRGDLDRIVLMALRKESDRRYRSAGDFAEDIDRFLLGMPVRAQRDTIGYRARKFVARNLGGVAAALLLLFSISAIAITTTVQSRRATRERDRAEQERAAAEDVVRVLTSLFERSNPMLVPGGDTLRIGTLVDDAEAQIIALSGQPMRQLRLTRAVARLRAARGERQRGRELLSVAWTNLANDAAVTDIERAGAYHELAMAVLATVGGDSARPMLDSSLATHTRLLGPDHPDLAIAYADRASVEADPATRRGLLANARRIRERSGTTGGIQQAQQLNAEGTARFTEGRWEEALARYEDAGEVLAGVQPAGHPQRLTVARNTASALIALGRWNEAESLLLATRVVETSSISPMQRASTIEKLGLTLANQGRLEEAEKLLRESLATSRAANAPRLANQLRNLGVVLAARGSVEAGVAFLDSAIAAEHARGSGNSTDVAFIQGQRSIMLLSIGRHAEGAALASASAARIRAAHPAGGMRVGDAEMWVGLAALQTGDALQARTHFGAAVNATRKALPLNHPKSASARCGLAVSLVRLGELDAARQDLAASCAIHAGWGLAQPILLKAAQEAVSILNVQSR